MEYRARYDPEADVLLLLLVPPRGRGELSHAEEFGDLVIHYGRNGEILLIEILNASKLIPRLVEALARRETTAA